jgi:hypothetical protein
MHELTGRQRAFVEELPKNKWNGTKAAIAAGYSAKSAHVMACRLLKNPKVVAAIDKRKAEIRKKTDFTVESQLNNFDRIATEAESNSDYTAALRGHENITKIIGGYEKDNKRRQGQGQTLIEILAIVDGSTKGVLPCEEVESQLKAGAKRVQSQVLPVAQAGPESPQNGRRATDGPGGG